VASTTVSDRTATRTEVLALRRQLQELAAAQRLTGARVDAAGTIIVHPADAGYGSLRRFAAAASKRVGVWVNVITDDVPAAQTPAEPL
jgi:hypothetical protein